MIKYFSCFLFLLPSLTFGQLFPKIADFKGNIQEVVEKTYGREADFFFWNKGKFRQTASSGRKYTYNFDKNSRLINRTETYRGKIVKEYVYQRDTVENKLIVREIITKTNDEHVGDYLEYENFRNDSGKIEKVNVWAFNAKECTRELILVEQNAEYKNDLLISFIHRVIDENGASTGDEKCSLFYNHSGKLVQIERKDLSSGFTTIIRNDLNDQGFVSHYSVDLLAELKEIPEKKSPDIYYQYDNEGNWIKMYQKSDAKDLLQAKRIIKYQ